MAPKVFDPERVATYNADHDQWSGGQTQDDGLYHPERYRPVTQGENGADNGFYKASQQGTIRQHSPSSTPKIGAYQQNQHGQQYSPPYQTQRPDGGSYSPHSKSIEQQQGSPNRFNNGAYQQSSSPNSQQKQPKENASGYLSNSAADNAAGLNPAAQGKPDSNDRYGLYLNQDTTDSSAASRNTLASNNMLPTATGTTSPTSSPTSSSTTSPTSSPSPNHEATSYRTATTALSAGLGVVLVGAIFASWLYRRRRQQKQQPKQSKKVPGAFQNPMAWAKGVVSSTKSPLLSSGSTSPSTDMILPSKSGAQSSTKKVTFSPKSSISSTKSTLFSSGSSSASTDMTVSSKSSAQSSTKNVTFSPKDSISSTKERVSRLYSSFVGAAVGTGVAVLGAVHELKTPKPQDDRGHVSDNVVKDDIEDSEPSPRDLSEEEKGNINYSTPTLVDSPTEEQQPPTLRRVLSGQPQMKSWEQLDTKIKKASTILEHDEDQPEIPDAHNTGDGAVKSEGKPASNPTDSPPRISRDSSFTSKGSGLQAIPEVPPSTNQFRVEIGHSAKKVGELDLREGQSVSIRQTFDDGWALCVFDESGHKGLAPRAYLSKEPIEPTPLKKLPTRNQSSSSLVSMPGSPRFYSQFGASQNFS